VGFGIEKNIRAFEHHFCLVMGHPYMWCYTTDWMNRWEECKPMEVTSQCMISAGLGACVEQQSMQVDISVQMKDLIIDCGEHHGLQAFKYEASKAGKWARFRYSCCYMEDAPLAVVPARTVLEPTADLWEGIYCPVKLIQPEDGINSRLDYKQVWNFRGLVPLEITTLKFNTKNGKWCSSAGCSAGPLLHPLDAQLDTESWFVRPVTDFATDFGVQVAKGAKKGIKPKKLPPPKLLSFAPVDPEELYEDECKAESDPASLEFKRDKMVEAGETLGKDSENPCYYVGTVNNGENKGSMAWEENDMAGNSGTPKDGITYKSVKECYDRQGTRDKELAKMTYAHSLVHNEHLTALASDAIDAITGVIPDPIVAPVGAGLKFTPRKSVSAALKMVLDNKDWMADLALEGYQQVWNQAADGDCDWAIHGLARTFCDLHCIRDAVKKGNKLMVDSVAGSVEVLNMNMQALFSHYLGEHWPCPCTDIDAG